MFFVEFFYVYCEYNKSFVYLFIYLLYLVLLFLNYDRKKVMMFDIDLFIIYFFCINY